MFATPPPPQQESSLSGSDIWRNQTEIAFAGMVTWTNIHPCVGWAAPDMRLDMRTTASDDCVESAITGAADEKPGT